MKLPYEAIPQRPGMVVTAAVWQKSGGRFRLRQVCYEPRKRREAEPEPPSAKRRQGLLL